MIDPTLALQAALVARLRAAVPACAGRVYDHVPITAVFPYIDLGQSQAIEDGGQDLPASEVTFTLHIWSRAVGAAEARRIAAEVAAALAGWLPDLASAGYAAADLQHGSSQVMDDPDGVTTHGVVTVTAVIEAA